jgi:chemotaxis protein CheX
MKKEDNVVLAALLVQMCRDLFAGNGEPFEELSVDTPVPDREGLLAACIGLSGQAVRGALVVVARPSFFKQMYPQELGVPRSEDDLADWAGELVNQLLGRLKNRLSSYGVDFTTSMPTVVRGDRLQLRAEEPPSILRPIKVRDERVDIHFEIKRDDDLPLLVAKGSEDTASPEGQAFLF